MGMPIAHGIAGGIGGIRTAGDLVARCEMTKMRLKDAKKYVANKLGIDVSCIADEFTMRKLREDLDICTITGVPNVARHLEAKSRIADILGIKIRSVDHLKLKMKV
jgi:dimethylamine--corrinoid protein Co-methyltransferase